MSGLLEAPDAFDIAIDVFEELAADDGVVGNRVEEIGLVHVRVLESECFGTLDLAHSMRFELKSSPT